MQSLASQIDINATRINNANNQLLADGQQPLAPYEIELLSGKDGMVIVPKRLRELASKDSWPFWVWFLIGLIVIGFIIGLVILILYLTGKL